jgi:4-amino-4-deoxy-L-arabinose transferase-like glycosyltransferase
LPLTNDEAYYWVWSQNLQLSYYDHPPFVAWLFWVGQHFNFAGSMVRWPGVVLGHATLAIWLMILRPLFTTEQLCIWLYIALLSPLVGGTNLVITPDLPLLFFNALSLWLFFRWRKQPVWWMALALGLSVGLGFSSKYVMVLFVLSLLPEIWLERQTRSNFSKQIGWIFLGVITGAAPVWLWNVMNDFASIRFQLDHGLGRSVWKSRWTSEYVLIQVALIFPWIGYWALQVRESKVTPPGSNSQWRIFHLLAWIPLGFFFLTTFRGYVEANWPIVAYPPVFALAVAMWPKSRKSILAALTLWTAVLTGLAVVVFAQPDWSKHLKFREFHQFDHLIPIVKDLNPLFTRSYQIAAKLHFELGRPVYKLRGLGRVDFYDYLDDSEPHGDVFYVIAHKRDILPHYLRVRSYKISDKKPLDDTLVLWTVNRLGKKR